MCMNGVKCIFMSGSELAVCTSGHNLCYGSNPILSYSSTTLLYAAKDGKHKNYLLPV